MLGRAARTVWDAVPFVPGCGGSGRTVVVDRAESWPSRMSRGRPSDPAPGVRCSGAGRPLSSRRAGCPLRDTGDAKLIVSLPPLPCRPCSMAEGRLMMDCKAVVECDEARCLSFLTPAMILILSPTLTIPISFSVIWSNSRRTSPRMSFALNMIAWLAHLMVPSHSPTTSSVQVLRKSENGTPGGGSSATSERTDVGVGGCEW